MNVKVIYLFFSIIIINFLLIARTAYSSALSDSTSDKKSIIISQSDSQAVKPKISKAPIIAFCLLGASIGGAIGEKIDPPKKVPEGEFILINYSKGGAYGCFIGAAIGGYLGYLLAKRDAKRELEMSKKIDINQKKLDKDKNYE
ncbi:MAG: hypothetical protein SCK70_00290 [bacterium]|nr:hypothetical protein [bacterium]